MLKIWLLYQIVFESIVLDFRGLEDLRSLGAPNMIVLNTKGVYYEEGMHTHEHFV